MDNENVKNENKKINIFKRFWYSIAKPNRYKELAQIGIKKAIIYFVVLIFVMSACYTAIALVSINAGINNGYFQAEENAEVLESYVNAKMIISSEDGLKLNTYYVMSYLLTMAFLEFFITNLIYLLIISIVGWFLAKSLKLKEKLKYREIFSMAIYAITLPTVIYIISSIVSIFVAGLDNIVSALYIILMYLYLFVAILLIKSKENKEEKHK
jgi:hypothetical protein